LPQEKFNCLYSSAEICYWLSCTLMVLQSRTFLSKVSAVNFPCHSPTLQHAVWQLLTVIAFCCSTSGRPAITPAGRIIEWQQIDPSTH
jgi:hypothetical protein